MVESAKDHFLKLHQRLYDMQQRISILETRENVALDSLSHNLVKNYPSIEMATTTQPLYWNVVTATLTEEDATGEGISSPPNEWLLKVVTSASNGYAYQRFTIAKERRLYAGQTVSVGAWIYSNTAGNCQMFLWDVTGGATVGSVKTVTTTGQWTYVQTTGDIPAGCASLDIRFRHSANPGTFYVANPVLNVGTQVNAFTPRRISPRTTSCGLYAAADPGGSPAGWISVDVPAVACDTGFEEIVLVEVFGRYRNTTTAGRSIQVRRTGVGFSAADLVYNTTTTQFSVGTVTVMLDASGTFEFSSNANAGDTETLSMNTTLLWVWE